MNTLSSCSRSRFWIGAWLLLMHVLSHLDLVEFKLRAQRSKERRALGLVDAALGRGLRVLLALGFLDLPRVRFGSGIANIVFLAVRLKLMIMSCCHL